MTRYARLNFALMLASFYMAGFAFGTTGFSVFVAQMAAIGFFNGFAYVIAPHAKRVDLSSKEFR